MCFILRNSHFTCKYFHSSLKLTYKSNLYVLDFSKTIFFFLANIHIIIRYYFCHQNHYMIILNPIDFINYNTHVSFSHVGLKILTVFAWSIFFTKLHLSIDEIEMFLININTFYFLWQMIYMWQTSPKLKLERPLTKIHFHPYNLISQRSKCSFFNYGITIVENCINFLSL